VASVAPREISKVYTVYPTDAYSVAETGRTEAYFRTLNVDLDPTYAKNNLDELVYWTITIDDDSVLGKLEAYHGVRELVPGAATLNQSHKDASNVARSAEASGSLPEFKLYFASPRDRYDSAENAETRKFLEEIIEDEKLDDSWTEFDEEEVPIDGAGLLLWGPFRLDDAKVEEVRNHKGIDGIEKAGVDEFHRALPEVERELQSGVYDVFRHCEKRGIQWRQDLDWKKQEKAPTDLVVDSEPK
jgi:hypothetical protein